MISSTKFSCIFVYKPFSSLHIWSRLSNGVERRNTVHRPDKNEWCNQNITIPTLKIKRKRAQMNKVHVSMINRHGRISLTEKSHRDRQFVAAFLQPIDGQFLCMVTSDRIFYIARHRTGLHWYKMGRNKVQHS